MSERVDMVGRRFGKWTAIKYVGDQRWLCRCDCGGERSRDGRSLRHVRSISCLACSRAERPSRLTHGGKWTRLYNIWCGMLRRCRTETDAAFPRYGGRGILVCREWKEDFVAFREWSLINGYADNLTIDRRDNDLGYSPGNCRWATTKEQNRNYSRVRMVDFEGKRVPVVELAERFGIKPYTLRQRLYRRNWPLERALNPAAYTFTVEKRNIDDGR